MEQIIAGVVISLITEIAKRVQSVPLNADQTNKVRAVVGGLSLIASLGMAYTQGGLATSNALPIISTAVGNYIFSILAYHGLIRQS
jgi:hypothetical protein